MGFASEPFDCGTWAQLLTAIHDCLESFSTVQLESAMVEVNACDNRGLMMESIFALLNVISRESRRTPHIYLVPLHIRRGMQLCLT